MIKFIIAEPNTNLVFNGIKLVLGNPKKYTQLSAARRDKNHLEILLDKKLEVLIKTINV